MVEAAGVAWGSVAGAAGNADTDRSSRPNSNFIRRFGLLSLSLLAPNSLFVATRLHDFREIAARFFTPLGSSVQMPISPRVRRKVRCTSFMSQDVVYSNDRFERKYVPREKEPNTERSEAQGLRI